MIKSRSIDNINGIYREQEHNGTVITPQTVQAQPLQHKVTKITLE